MMTSGCYLHDFIDDDDHLHNCRFISWLQMLLERSTFTRRPWGSCCHIAVLYISVKCRNSNMNNRHDLVGRSTSEVATLLFALSDDHHNLCSAFPESPELNTTLGLLYIQTANHQVKTTRWKPPGESHQVKTTSWKQQGENHQVKTTRWKPLGENHQMKTTRWKPPGENHQVKTTRWKQPGENH